MNPDEITKRQRSMCRTGALLVPLLHTASRCSWVSVLAVGAPTVVACCLLPGYLNPPGKWLRRLQAVWNCLLISQVLRWNESCWPSHENAYGSSLILLALAAWSVMGGKKRNAGIACVLLFPVALLLGTVLGTAGIQMQPDRLMPIWSMPDAWLIVVLLCLLLERGEEGKEPEAIGIWGLGILAAIISSGVMSAAVSGSMEVPLYEISRSNNHGVRLESLTAVAMTLGYFITIGYLLSSSTGSNHRRVWIYGIISGSLYITGWIEDSRIIAVGSIILWVILPVLETIRRNVKKSKNNA